MGVPYTDTELSVPLWRVVTLQKNVTSGISWQGREGDLTSQLHDWENHRGKFSFSGQECQGVCLLCSTSRKSIAEGFLLGDLCFMKFMPGAEDWGAGNDRAVFLPSAALIVCNDLISSSILPCSKHRHVAFYCLY